MKTRTRITLDSTAIDGYLRLHCLARRLKTGEPL